MLDHDLRGRNIRDEDVLAALAKVPRPEFVPEAYLEQAWGDYPLPIGHGQTISQPYIVALMTELLALEPGHRVLEVGTGSGYQAAILAQIVGEVYTVEIIRPLALDAGERLARLGCGNVHVRCCDGYFGWPEHAPYDAIIVTAAAEEVPPPLLEQLKDGGRLVVPIGPPGGYQILWAMTKRGGELQKRDVTGVLFVPLTGSHVLAER